ncbi:LPXTG cell wall anchor domain-containing protein [Candidatus Saccharibacteria bacterium]|nr:LPXTG cell wall anchor domain-containing protein [Candidatus Saccharibacteria bacterium]
MNKQQSGSVAVFAIVGVLLAALIVGAIVISQRRGSESRVAFGPQELRQADPGNQKQPKADKKTDNPKSKDKSDKVKESEQNKDSSKQLDDDKRKKAEGDKSTEDKLREEAIAKAKRQHEAEAAREAQPQPQTQTGDGPMSRTGGVGPADLPETGPAEDLLMMTIGVVAIVGSGYFYYHYGRR